MKKLLLLIFLIPLMSAGQTVNGFEIEEIPAKYVQIVSTSKLLKTFQVTVYLDYGQIGRMKEIKKGHILGSDGKPFSFNGVMGVLNFFDKKGFKYVNQYLVTAGGSNVYRTLLENTNYKE
tara:strand:+ start:64 stop:423 length:360 start_codon:yes stop_codon:yes gene_type:complete